ncbi:MAG: MBL fold metallo-hydrolase [Rhodobacteraceae bacterium]|nr:MBL fold metallo-hydrolase [Paracoccaceae bacterium]
MNTDPGTLKITLLGTGMPKPNINAFGTATMIEAGQERVLIDCGRGTVIRMSQMGFATGHTDTLILSHYHSDHYAGIFDLLMTGTMQHPHSNRGGPLHVYGPPGVTDIADGAWIATRPDRNIRVADHEIDPEHMRIIPHEYSEGVVYEKNGLKIIAIEVDHGEFIDIAYGFRVEYNGHVFVHSHDTRYNENLIAQAHDADVFVHEVAGAPADLMAENQKVKLVIDHHATPAEVGRVFARTKPRLAMLTHLVLLPPDEFTIDMVMADLAEEYDGIVLVAEDLMTIEIGKNISVIPYNHGARPG